MQTVFYRFLSYCETWKSRPSLAVSLRLYYFCGQGCRRTCIHSRTQPSQTECHVLPFDTYSVQFSPQHPSACGLGCHLRNRHTPPHAPPSRAAFTNGCGRAYHGLLLQRGTKPPVFFTPRAFRSVWLDAEHTHDRTLGFSRLTGHLAVAPV